MILEMRNICKDYPMGKTVTRVLRDVSLDVAEGEYLAIMGPSGSGKTTLMNIIGCLDEPTSGSYLLCGQDITACTDLQLAQVRNHIQIHGSIRQKCTLYHPSYKYQVPCRLL